MTNNAQRGGALVEFAAVLPVAMFLLLGILQMSFLLYAYHAVGNAARLGARWMGTHGADCINTSGTDAKGNPLCIADNAALTYYVQSQMPGLSTSAATLTVNGVWSNPPSTWAYQPAAGCSTSAAYGCIATVTITYHFKYIADFVNLGLPKTTIKTTSQFITQ